MKSKKATKKKKVAKKKATKKKLFNYINANLNILSGPTEDFSPYLPKRGEEYMSSGQLKHFKKILVGWKNQLIIS